MNKPFGAQIEQKSINQLYAIFHMNPIFSLLLNLFIFFLLLVISALPLHFAVMVMRGRTNLLKSTLVMVACAIIVVLLIALIPFGGGLLSLPILIFIYIKVFYLSWYRAILVWIIQMVFIMLFTFLIGLTGLEFLSLTSVEYWFQ